MSNSKKIWLAVSIGIVVLFLWGIPLSIYEGASFLYSGMGALLLFISLFLFFGDFTSLDEIFEKQDKNKPQPAGRNFAPFMVFPAFIFLFITVFYHSSKKEKALETNGVLVKGVVLNGESTQRTRRMQTTTSYELQVQFKDSLGSAYHFDQSVSGGEFNGVYKGAVVDVVYWREDPNIAKIVFDIAELSKYRNVPNESVSITNLTAILNGSVKEDSVNAYLNSINYEWITTEKNIYENSRLKQAVNYKKEEGVIVFVESNNMLGYVINEDGKQPFSFEKDLIEKGYKKQASAGEDGKAVELYYTNEYLVQKTTKVEHSDDGSFGMDSYVIYLITKVNR